MKMSQYISPTKSQCSTVKQLFTIRETNYKEDETEFMKMVCVHIKLAHS